MAFLIDFTDTLNNNLLYGGNAGLKKGIIFRNENWIIKFPQDTSEFEGVDISYTTSPLSEYVGSHIYEILGYDVHKTELGIYKNDKINRTQLVVGCLDFTNKGKYKLIDYECIKNNYSDNLEIKLGELRKSLPAYKNKNLSSHSIPIEEIILQFKENQIFVNHPEAQKLFWEMIIIDCLINNNDRNKNNWGFLFDLEHNSYSFAPIYDNGASFVTKHSDEKMERLLNDNCALENSALNGMSYYTIGHELLNFHNFFKKLMANKLDANLKKVLPSVVDNILDKWPTIVNFIDNIPEAENGIKIISNIQKEFFIKTMKIRLDNILVPLKKVYLL